MIAPESVLPVEPSGGEADLNVTTHTSFTSPKKEELSKTFVPQPLGAEGDVGDISIEPEKVIATLGFVARGASELACSEVSGEGDGGRSTEPEIETGGANNEGIKDKIQERLRAWNEHYYKHVKPVERKEHRARMKEKYTTMAREKRKDVSAGGGGSKDSVDGWQDSPLTEDLEASPTSSGGVIVPFQPWTPAVAATAAAAAWGGASTLTPPIVSLASSFPLPPSVMAPLPPFPVPPTSLPLAPLPPPPPPSGILLVPTPVAIPAKSDESSSSSSSAEKMKGSSASPSKLSAEAPIFISGPVASGSISTPEKRPISGGSVSSAKKALKLSGTSPVLLPDRLNSLLEKVDQRLVVMKRSSSGSEAPTSPQPETEPTLLPSSATIPATPPPPPLPTLRALRPSPIDSNTILQRSFVDDQLGIAFRFPVIWGLNAGFGAALDAEFQRWNVVEQRIEPHNLAIRFAPCHPRIRDMLQVVLTEEATDPRISLQEFTEGLRHHLQFRPPPFSSISLDPSRRLWDLHYGYAVEFDFTQHCRPPSPPHTTATTTTGPPAPSSSGIRASYGRVWIGRARRCSGQIFTLHQIISSKRMEIGRGAPRLAPTALLNIYVSRPRLLFVDRPKEAAADCIQQWWHCMVANRLRSLLTAGSE